MDQIQPAEQVNIAEATFCCEAEDIRSSNELVGVQEKIGSKRKEERLRFIQKYWSDQVRNVPGIRVNTPKDPSRCCGIGNVWVEKLSPTDMGKILMDKYKIFTAP